MSKISFGTSGWRGILTQDFTPARVAAVADAVGVWLAMNGPKRRVLLAHDTRCYGRRFALLASRVLRGRGAAPFVVQGFTPTPVAAYGLRHLRGAAALVFTASHNPAAYHGLKVLADWGGAVGDEEARRLETLADESLRSGVPRQIDFECESIDLAAPYLDALARQLDGAALSRSQVRVVYDAMHGTGAGFFDRVMRTLGVPVRVLRGNPDPRFGGVAPDPAAERLEALRGSVARGRGLRLGIATDGDADRCVAVDEDGRVLSSAESVALLVDHLARNGRVRKGVALSVVAGSLAERVARAHGLSVCRKPIGFKHLSPELVSGAADAAGDESDGFAWEGLGRDKDGILAASLLAELVAQTGQPLGAHLRALEARHGCFRCARTAVPLDARSRDALARLESFPPPRILGRPVREVESGNGIRLGLEDGFLMLRVSGTEPVVRVYAEAPDAEHLRLRLCEGMRLLGAT
jgi:phosphomannomutase